MIIEDGTGVEGADSFVSTSDANAFLSARDRDDINDALLVQAIDALAILQYRGSLVSVDQSLPFPRVNMISDSGDELSNDGAIKAIKAAQIWTAFYIQQGHDPSAVASRAVKREKVDVLEREFFEGNSEDSVSISDLPMVAALLQPYLRSGATSTGYGTGYIDHA